MEKINKVQYTLSAYAEHLGVSRYSVYKYIELGLISVKRTKTGRVKISIKK